jgi:hypothetical protein
MAAVRRERDNEFLISEGIRERDVVCRLRTFVRLIKQSKKHSANLSEAREKYEKESAVMFLRLIAREKIKDIQIESRRLGCLSLLCTTNRYADEIKKSRRPLLYFNLLGSCNFLKYIFLCICFF